MKIESVSNLLPIHFDHDKIKTLLYDTDGNLSVINKDNEHLLKFHTKASVAYNRQYGTPISPDGRYVFIGTWEHALFCYSLESGTLVWKQTPGKIRNIIVHENLLFVEMADRGIYVRDLDSGKLLQEIKMSSIDSFFLLNQTELFAGPKNGKYFLFEIPFLKIKTEIKTKSLNIHNSLSFIILDVYYKDNDLMIKGWEQYKDGNYKDSKQTSFERKMPIA
jgi:hypothetical protein